MYCSNCGTKLEEKYKFCPKCGNKVFKEENKEDNLYESVKMFVVKESKITIPMIQKEFDLAYKDASKIMNRLEEDKIVGPSNGPKGREVLINKIEDKKDETVEDKVMEAVNNIMNTEDSTEEFDKKDIKDNTFLALLSYLSLLAFIPYFASNNSKFVKYHATQGMNLLIIWGIYTIVNNLLNLIKVSEIVVNMNGIKGSRLVTPTWISFPLGLVNFILTALSIIGIIYVLEGKAKELPLIGKLKIVK